MNTKLIYHSVLPKHAFKCPLAFVQIVAASYNFFLFLLFVQQNQQKVHKKRMNLSSEDIRTSCCAAWPPVSESLDGPSWVCFCRLAPATGGQCTHSPSVVLNSRRSNTRKENSNLTWKSLMESVDVASQCRWCPWSQGAFCPGGCWGRCSPPRRYLCCCSGPRIPQTPETQVLLED